MTNPEADLWHIGPFAFPTAAMLFPLVAGLAVWGFASLSARYRAAKVPILLVPVAVGALLAYGSLSAPSSYAASFAFGQVWIISAMTVLGSLLLLPLRRTRRAGIIGTVEAILISFYAVYLVGHRLGLYDWRVDALVPLNRIKPR